MKLNVHSLTKFIKKTSKKIIIFALKQVLQISLPAAKHQGSTFFESRFATSLRLPVLLRPSLINSVKKNILKLVKLHLFKI